LTNQDNIIFIETKLKSYGLAIGYEVDPIFMPDGFRATELRLSFAKTNVHLTNEIELDEFLPNYSTYRMGLNLKFTFKKELGVTKNNFILIDGFLYYFNYWVNNNKTGETEFNLGNDIFLGLNLGLFF